MPYLEFFLGIIITVLVVVIIYKDGKEKEAIHNYDFINQELGRLNVIIHEKDEEIKKLKNKEKEDDIEIL